MKSDKEVIDSQLDLIKQASILFDERIKVFTPLQEEAFTISAADSAIRIYQIRALKRYKEILDFLGVEAQSEDEKKYIYLLPNVRTLLDIYANFVHLEINCPSNDDKAIFCIAHSLLIAKTLKNSNGKYPYYDETFKLYKDFIARAKPDFPQNPELLSKNWMRDNKLFAAQKEILLTPANMNRFSSYSIKVFGIERTYEIYSSISEILHGNPYYYKEESYNERFWIISMCLRTSAFLIEYIDRYILDKGQKRDFRDWLSSCENTKKEYVSVWKKRIETLKQVQ